MRKKPRSFCYLASKLKMVMEKLSLLKGVIVAYILFTSTFLGCAFFITPILPFLAVKPIIFRRITDAQMGFWLSFTALMIEKVFTREVRITGDKLHRNESSLILLNHRTRLDWLYVPMCIGRYCNLSSFKIVLKSVLKKIPGPGWAMQAAGFVFLQRLWDEDEKHLSRIIKYFSKTTSSFRLLLFPEGTDYTAYTLERSNAFADKNGLARLRFVLQPRTTGFVHIVQQMRKCNIADAVYDITVAYPESIPNTELDFVNGRVPKVIHFHVRRYDIKDLPTDEAELGAWCQQMWREKDEILARLYRGKPHLHPLVSAEEQLEAAPGASAHGDPALEHTWRRDPPSFYMWLALPLWTMYLVLFHWLLLCSPLARCFCLLSIPLYLTFQKVYGGLDLLQLDTFKFD